MNSRVRRKTIVAIIFYEIHYLLQYNIDFSLLHHVNIFTARFQQLIKALKVLLEEDPEISPGYSNTLQQVNIKILLASLGLALTTSTEKHKISSITRFISLNCFAFVYETYTEPQKKRRNFDNSIRYGKKKYLFLFFKIQVFIATQGVGTHHKKLSNNKLPLH